MNIVEITAQGILYQFTIHHNHDVQTVVFTSTLEVSETGRSAYNLYLGAMNYNNQVPFDDTLCKFDLTKFVIKEDEDTQINLMSISNGAINTINELEYEFKTI
ncbi:MAG: hypothetical protein R3Y47_12835 [Lachnospiraceae bacterium]